MSSVSSGGVGPDNNNNNSNSRLLKHHSPSLRLLLESSSSESSSSESRRQNRFPGAVSFLAARFRHSLTSPYVSPAAFQRARGYKYHALEGTELDKIINAKWWSFLATLVPDRVHPNLLTFAGFLASLTATCLYLGRDTPRWHPFCAALLMFLYQSLDAIDGKQARRVGVSSALGQLFDHGCDAVTGLCSIFMVTGATGIRGGRHAAALGAVMATQLFMYNWYEKMYGQFRSSTGPYTGVTEGQNLIIMLSLVAAFSPSFFQLPLEPFLRISPFPIPSLFLDFTTTWNLVDVLFVVCTGILYVVSVKDILSTVSSPPPNSSSRLLIRDCAVFMAHSLGVYQTIFYFYGNHPSLTIFLVASFNALPAWKLMISSVTQTAFQPQMWHAIPWFAVCLSTLLLPTFSKLNFWLAIWVSLWGGGVAWCFLRVNLGALKEVVGCDHLFIVPRKNLIELSKLRVAQCAASEQKNYSCKFNSMGSNAKRRATLNRIMNKGPDLKSKVAQMKQKRHQINLDRRISADSLTDNNNNNRRPDINSAALESQSSRADDDSPSETPTGEGRVVQHQHRVQQWLDSDHFASAQNWLTQQINQSTSLAWIRRSLELSPTPSPPSFSGQQGWPSQATSVFDFADVALVSPLRLAASKLVNMAVR